MLNFGIEFGYLRRRREIEVDITIARRGGCRGRRGRCGSLGQHPDIAVCQQFFDGSGDCGLRDPRFLRELGEFGLAVHGKKHQAGFARQPDRLVLELDDAFGGFRKYRLWVHCYRLAFRGSLRFHYSLILHPAGAKNGVVRTRPAARLRAAY